MGQSIGIGSVSAISGLKCIGIGSVVKSGIGASLVTTKIYGQFMLRSQGSHHVLPPYRHLSLSAKMNYTQRRILVSPRRMCCTFCGMPKDTSRAEVTLNSEKIKPVALAVIELCLSESISQSGSRRKFRLITLKNLLKAFQVDQKAQS